MWQRGTERVADGREIVAGSECLMASEGRAFQAYNEHAFRYFLSLECTRAARSNRALTLVLSSVMSGSSVDGWRIDPVVAQKLFAGLWLSTREADFIGWYREGQVAGAVLTHCSTDVSAGLSRRIRARVASVLGAELSRGLRQDLRVHVCPLRPNIASARATGAL